MTSLCAPGVDQPSSHHQDTGHTTEISKLDRSKTTCHSHIINWDIA